MVADTLLVLDNLYNRATVSANVDGGRRADAELRRLTQDAEAGSTDWLERLAAPSRSGRYELRAARCRPCRAPTPTRAGDVAPHQGVHRGRRHLPVVLSRRSSSAAPDPSSPTATCGRSIPRRIFFLHCDDIHASGSSPEILVRVEDGKVTSARSPAPARAAPTPERTRARGRAARRSQGARRARDAGGPGAQRRRPGGRVRLGAVTDLMTVERYSHVMHLVSEVSGRLRPGLDARGGARRSLPGRHGDRRAQGARDADHRRAGAGPPRPLRRRGRLHRLGRPHAWTPPSPSAPGHARRPRLDPGRRRHRGRFGSGGRMAGDGGQGAGGAAGPRTGSGGRQAGRAGGETRAPAGRRETPVGTSTVRPSVSVPYCTMPFMSLPPRQHRRRPELRARRGPDLVVGRGPTSDIAIYDPTISRRHAELRRRRRRCR